MCGSILPFIRKFLNSTYKARTVYSFFGKISRTLVVTVVLILLGSALQVPVARGENRDLIEAGDYLQVLIPAAGLAGTYVADDPEGRSQFWKTYLSANLITTVGKGVYSKLRPRGTARVSFPSGHTTAAFVGAGFIDSRYGHLWGSIAYSAAALTGYSRIDADAHFADDVLAGASVGLFNTWYWVTPYKSTVSLLPMAVKDGVGVMISVQDPRFVKEEEILEGKRPRKFRYELAFGSAFLEKNEITAPESSGTTFNLADFDKVDDPLTTAQATFDWFIADRHTVSIFFWPMEIRDTGTFAQPVRFGGEVFPANVSVASQWRHYKLDVMYMYDLVVDSPWSLRVGGGISGQWTTIKLNTSNAPVISSAVEDWVVLPLLSLDAGYAITDTWRLQAGATGMYLDQDKYFSGSLEARYRFSQRWEGGIGVGNYSRDIETSELRENFSYNTLYLTASYTFF